MVEHMRGSRSKVQQYGGERTLLNKKETQSILNSLVNFAVYLDPRMVDHMFHEMLTLLN